MSRNMTDDGCFDDIDDVDTNYYGAVLLGDMTCFVCVAHMGF